MPSLALVDLYFPAHAASLPDLQAAATAAGLDAVIVAVEAPEDAPDAATLAEVNARSGARVHTAWVVAGPGFRLLAIPGARGFDGVGLDALEAAADERVARATLAELGALVVPVSPRQGAGGTVARQLAVNGSPGAEAGKPAVGAICLVTGGSRLGRDLDLEDAALAQRRVLGATGPFGQLGDLGRYASLLPAAADQLPALVEALGRGLGLAVELGPRRGARPQRTPVQPHEGREDDAPAKRGRRRRRRGPRPGGPPPPAAS